MSKGGRGKRNREREEAIVERLGAYHAEHGVAPTMFELAEAVGLSQPVLHRYLERLESEGRVLSLWVAGRRSPRALRVLPPRQLVLL